MAKKTRRAKAKHRARVEKAAQEGRLQQPGPLPAEAPAPTRVYQKVRSPKAQDLAGRYQYVISDVKRIGIIAGAIILILIILSFVLG